MTKDVNYKPLPDYIQKYAFNFKWDNNKVWALEVPDEVMDISELVWHFDIPWLHTPEGRFDVTPIEIMQHPKLHVAQYRRTMESDINYPIDVMFNKGRWLILDGLHRLMKSVLIGKKQVVVRKIPHSMIHLITK